MLIPLSDVLALPSFRAAGAQVLAGHPEGVLVRWVHSSEVFEMGGLLAGGEVLLTTGLGLHGRTSEHLTAYVEQLADAGLAALALELGRTFFEVPAAILEAAGRRQLVVLGLRQVVPFERMVEDFHELLLRRKLLWRRVRASRCGRSCSASSSPAGPGRRPARHRPDGRLPGRAGRRRRAGRRAQPHSRAGRLGRPHRRRGPRPTRARRPARPARPAHGRPHQRGRPGGRRRRARTGPAPDLGSRPSLAQAVVTPDLVAGVLVSQGDLQARLSAAGWVPAPGTPVAVLAVEVDRRTPASEAVPAVREAAESVLGRCLVGAAGSAVVVLARGWPRSALRRNSARPLEELFRHLRGGALDAAVRTIGVADPVGELAAVPEAVARAREVVMLSRRIGSRQPVVLAQDVAVHRLLAGGLDASELAAFVTAQLGPLVDHDAAHGTDLLRTLDAHVAPGLSKTRTAEVLGVRRQKTLYARLERIEHLLGAPVDDPGQRTCLGWR